jgi:hypothetical protein
VGIVAAVAIGVGVGVVLWAPPAPPPDAEQQEPQTVFVTAAKGIRWITITGVQPMRVGQSAPLHSVAYDANQRPVPNAPVAWVSDDPSIVTVDPKTGLVTAIASGVGHVRATVAGRVATVSVIVRPQLAE